MFLAAFFFCSHQTLETPTCPSPGKWINRRGLATQRNSARAEGGRKRPRAPPQGGASTRDDATRKAPFPEGRVPDDDTRSYGIPEKANAAGTRNSSAARWVSTGAHGGHTGRCDRPARLLRPRSSKPILSLCKTSSHCTPRKRF